MPVRQQRTPVPAGAEQAKASEGAGQGRASAALGPGRGTAALGRHRTGLSSLGSQQSSSAPAEAPGDAEAKPARSILHPPGGGGDPRCPHSSSSPGGTGLLVQARPAPGLPHRWREPGWGAKPPPLRACARTGAPGSSSGDAAPSPAAAAPELLPAEAPPGQAAHAAPAPGLPPPSAAPSSLPAPSRAAPTRSRPLLSGATRENEAQPPAGPGPRPFTSGERAAGADVEGAGGAAAGGGARGRRRGQSPPRSHRCKQEHNGASGGRAAAKLVADAARLTGRLANGHRRAAAGSQWARGGGVPGRG